MKILKYGWIVGSAVVGALAGYLYYYHVGCVTGNCPITSKPVPAIMYGAVIGILAVNIFRNNNYKK